MIFKSLLFSSLMDIKLEMSKLMSKPNNHVSHICFVELIKIVCLFVIAGN